MRIHRPLLPLFAAIAALLSLMSFGYAQSAANPGDKVVLGRVGQVLKDAKVYSKDSTRSKVYFTVKEGEFIVVRSEAPRGWIKVLLNNGKYGYADVSAIEALNYEVTTEAGPSPRPASTTASRSGSARGNSTVREAAAEKGLDYLGTPYVWGGNDVDHGIDCSGFVQQLYGNFGVNLPRTAAEQALVGQSITRLEELKKGDRLYFWDAKRGKIGHTGLYLGGGKFVHSSSSRKGVAVDSLHDGKWLKILVSARR